MKTVSRFEYAIMQAAHESDPTKVTKEDLDNMRPLSEDEELQKREDNLRSQASKIRFNREVAGV